MHAIICEHLKLYSAYRIKVCDEIEKLPAGSLLCSIRGSKRYYCQSHYCGKIRKKTYLGTTSGKNAGLISALKRKRFLLDCKTVLEKNVAALGACLKKFEDFDPAQISSRLAATYENITDGKIPGDKIFDDTKKEDNDSGLDWQHAPYSKADMHAENLKHEAVGGLMVRSKSEALIAFALDLADVPFHYEEILELDGKRIAPDFTILHPLTGERVYWEHFGMMDDPAYANETYKKLVLYGQNGIIPSKNLVYTMETNADPLSIREVQRLILHHFLA